MQLYLFNSKIVLICVGAQSTLGARHFCPKICMKNYLNARIVVLYMIFPEKLTQFPNFSRFLPENARIFHNNYPKNIFPIFLGGRRCTTCPCPRLLRLRSYSMFTRKRIKQSTNRTKKNTRSRQALRCIVAICHCIVHSSIGL